MTKPWSVKRGARLAKYVQSNIWITLHTQIVSTRKQRGDEVSVQFMLILTAACDLKNLLILLLQALAR